MTRRTLALEFQCVDFCINNISIFLENKEGKKTEVTLSLILRFNLRLRGYSIWSASTSRTIYDQDLGLELLTALKQMEVLRGLLGVSEGRPRSNQVDVLTT